MSDYKLLEDTLVVGLGHRARQGKDLAARFIAATYPHVDVQRFAFADALKALCRVDYDMTEKDAPLLQRVGVLKRCEDPEVWVRALYWSIAERRPALALITDVRFENEVEMIRSIGGHVVKVERTLPDGDIFCAADRDPRHISETALDDCLWDAVIENPDGDLDAFRAHTHETFLQLSAGW